MSDGVRLPYNHRQKVFPNGTLSVIELERVTDQGVYTCIARTRDDARSSAKTSFSLKVLGMCFHVLPLMRVPFRPCLQFLIYSIPFGHHKDSMVS